MVTSDLINEKLSLIITSMQFVHVHCRQLTKFIPFLLFCTYLSNIVWNPQIIMKSGLDVPKY